MNNTKNQNKVAAVIPFFNEENTIVEIINETKNYVDDVITVNDGSTDHSLLRIEGIPGITLINFDENFGKGKALREGFRKALELDCSYVVTIDSDLQHDPAFIPKLISGLEDYDVVIGNRLSDLESMPVHRRLSNKISSYLLSKKTGQKILDSQSGFRAFRRKVVEDVSTEDNHYIAESEFLINASRRNFKIGFCNIPTIYGNEVSKIRPVKIVIDFIKIMFI